MTFTKLFLSPHGRMGRQHYWIGFAVLFVAQIVANFIPSIGGLIGLALIYPAVCVYGKRLHDLGRSAWWLAAVVAATLLCIIIIAAVAVAPMVAASGGPRDEIAMFTSFWEAPGVKPLVVVMALINIGFVVWLGVAPGQAGPNKYDLAPAPAEESDDDGEHDA